MDATAITTFASRALYMAMILALPLLLICLAIGVVISIFQATTQIHEQSLSFVPKLIAVIVSLAIMGTWMVNQLESFTREAFSKIAGM
ncbi:MAG: flagellar biosynthesis protein FliQ [Clostridia bacterium]|nr:flagellar biosynthesis protein FliQ [Clostridia bacterium]MDR3645358.1 flagellar biosynthesis protein FliQ [Clostridia bacterium]